MWTNKTLIRPVGVPRADGRCYNTANNPLILQQQLPVDACGQWLNSNSIANIGGGGRAGIGGNERQPKTSTRAHC